MRNLFRLLPLALLLLASSCRTVPPRGPLTAEIPKKLTMHGDVRTDEYYWLKERGDKKVLDHLKAENRYTKAVLAHTKGFQKRLFKEMKARIQEDDTSVPYKQDGWYYYHRTFKGKEYPVYCRKKGSLGAPEEVILDVNKLAKGHAFYNVAAVEPSPGHSLLAFTADERGRRLNTMRVKDLRTGKLLPDRVAGVSANVVWAKDDRTLFYVLKDTVTLRSYKVLRHVLGEERDVPVYEEKDETFSVGVGETRSRKWLVMGSYSTLSTEYRILRADEPAGTWRVFQPREPKHEYFIAHGGDRFYVLTNWDAKNFRLMETPEDRTGKEDWKEVWPHRKDVLLDDVEAFEGHLAFSEKENGLTYIRIVDRKTRKDHRIRFDDPTYMVSFGENPEYKTKTLRYVYDSLTTPETTYDEDMDTGERVLLKRRPVLGGFKAEDYRSERFFATAPDGTKIPVSLVYRKDTPRSARAPLYLTGYGAYGISFDPYFSSVRLSLLDRGFVWAIAHIRGGSEMGRKWYEDGRQMRKKNTFTDFIACAEHLVREGYTSPKHLYIEGGSAGGLLMGAVLNMRPDLFRGALVDVPFVDALTTMLDPSIPLTTGEYDEWGNPNHQAAYDYIKSYSPYDNIKARAYPSILATTGLQDSQVQYWEPAKWVARLRERKKGPERVLLWTDMSTGHGGASGRFEALKLYAMQYAFVMDLEGIRE